MIVSHLLGAFYPAFWFWQEQVAPQSTNLVELIWRASPVAKVVLLVLFGFSIASWAIIFAKGRTTRKAQQQCAQFVKVFDQSRRWADLYGKVSTYKESPLGAIFLAANEELQRQPRLNLEAVQRIMQSATISETTKLEQSLGWLASVASAAPFIGLFGTVVGIILAFQGLSQSTTSSIQAVAPGIAEALIATAAGIAAAVPAVLGYNYLLNRIKVLAAEMDRFSLQLLNFIEREAAGYAPGARSERVSG
ncbi:MAG TPA: MotA/TolQ/ExbB proton channel family protein [Blastocatellia bacterium]|nr:MotA/TolQ/ExbB proton channel family protein [Blastocatellia bacterium]